jgi:hypothetical protein
MLVYHKPTLTIFPHESLKMNGFEKSQDQF